MSIQLPSDPNGPQLWRLKATIKWVGGSLILGYVVMRATSPSAKEIELVKRTSQENNAKNYNAIARNNQTIIQTILSSAGAPVEVKEKPPLTTEKLAPTLQERLQGK